MSTRRPEPARSAGGAVPALELSGVSLAIDGVQILDGVDLSIAKGELVAMIGPNGAGKTSLVNVTSGASLPTSGTVRLDGRDVTRWAPHRRARVGMGRTFQTSNLFLGSTVHENVRLAATVGGLGLLSSLVPARSSRAQEGRIHARLELVGLETKAGDQAGSLSHGDKRKLELAMVLAQDPSLILLDEPLAGVNTEDVPGLVELVRRVHREQGVTIVMVEHHMHVVLDLADRIAVMHHGALLAIDEPAAVIANETVQSAYLGESL